jgi:sensor histidine kinase YesM
MNRETVCFRDSIRKTFISYSIVPVVVTALVILSITGIAWNNAVTYRNENENRETAEKISHATDIWYGMINEAAEAFLKNDGSVPKDRIAGILYEKCGEFGETGNLVMLEPSGGVLYASAGNVPYYLKEAQYMDWGILHNIRKATGITVTALSEGNICMGKAVYEKDELKCLVVYIVPDEVIKQMTGAVERFFAITDENGWIYAENSKMLRDAYGKLAAAFDTDTGYVKASGKLYYLCRTVVRNGLTVWTVDDMSDHIRVFLLLIGVVIMVFAGIVFITYKSTDASSEKYTADIRRIEAAFESVSKGDLDVRLNTDSSREFTTIGNDFNEMLESLRGQIAENKELATDVAFAQLKQLESQLNPHFLFNTLDNIRFMAKIDAEAADKMIVSLSGILRYTIRDTREEVTLREDLNNLRYYLNILQIRFNKRFKYATDFGDDLMDCLIPKLLLQPLLENAIKHGFGNKEKLFVTIRGYKITDKLVFICEDDGAGIAPEKLKEIRESLAKDDNETAHYGLYNIHRRIKLMYKGDYGLDIDSKEGEGTLVRIVLPRREK